MTLKPRHDQRGETRAFQRLLVATDFSPGSKRAFRKALALARDLGAELHLLHVANTPEPRSVFLISVAPDAQQAVGRRLRSRAARRFEDFLRGEIVGETAVRTALREGRPHEQIVGYAVEEGVDLIVVGERPESRVQHLLQHLAFESVGERVRREAPCPVLTVR
jgi:nucleotide-binding universal stress UspA family protein